MSGAQRTSHQHEADRIPPATDARHWHPMEVFPLFRRWRQGVVRDLVYTFIFSALVACLFSALALIFTNRVDVARILAINFIMSQFIGFSIHFLYLSADVVLARVRRTGFLARTIDYGVIPILGALIGYWLAATVFEWSAFRAQIFTPRGLLEVVLVAGVIASILLAIFLPRERAAQAEVKAARDEARANAAEKEATLARMQLLEAQVEPHFLYNTLAHVVSLVDSEPAVAKRMLDRLIILLRATASSATRSSTLGAQLDLLRAYLDLIALRMGSRLKWSIDVAPELSALTVPPMLLQPVVENAIKHGLEPKIAGGSVDVTATRNGEALVLTVADTGLGISATRDPRSSGLGLPNLRARLAALYGTAAALVVADNEPTGTRVTISLPLSLAR